MRELSFVAPRADRLVPALLLATILLVSAGCMRMGGMPNLGNAFGQGGRQGLDPSGGPERGLQTSPDTRQMTTEILPPEELYALYGVILSNYVDRVDHRVLLEGALRGVHAGAMEQGLLPMEAAVLDTMPLQISPDPQRDFAQFGDRYGTFLNKLVPRVGTTHMGQAAARGMLEALNDPLTTYVDRETVAAQEATEYVGVGVVLAVSEDGDPPIIRDVFPGSPAESAGLRPGDTIVSVDGKSMESTPLNDAVNRVRGPEGSAVTLGVQSVGQGGPRDVQVVRASVPVAAVESEVRDDVGFVRIWRFQEGVADAMRDALTDSATRGARSWVVDVRANSGGDMREIINAASLFVGDQIVGLLVDRSQQPAPIQGSGRPMSPLLPTVLVVDRDTAAGAEVFAAALAQNDVATVVGTTTAGRVGLASTFPLSDGSAAQITTARILTPSSDRLDQVGLRPDEVVESNAADWAEGRDPQLDQAIALARASEGRDRAIGLGR